MFCVKNFIYFPLTLYKNLLSKSIILLLLFGKLGLREVKQPAQGYTDGIEWSHNLNLSLTPKFVIFSTSPSPFLL